MSDLTHLLEELQETRKDLYAALTPRRTIANPDTYHKQHGRCPWRHQYKLDDSGAGGRCVRVGPTMNAVRKWGRNSLLLKKEDYTPLSWEQVAHLAERSQNPTEIDNAFQEAKEQDWLHTVSTSRGAALIELFANNPYLSPALFTHIYDNMHSYAQASGGKHKGQTNYKGTIRDLQQTLLLNPAIPLQLAKELLLSVDSSVWATLRNNSMLSMLFLEDPTMMGDLVRHALKTQFVHGTHSNEIISYLQDIDLIPAAPKATYDVSYSNRHSDDPKGPWVAKAEEWTPTLFRLFWKKTFHDQHLVPEWVLGPTFESEVGKLYGLDTPNEIQAAALEKHQASGLRNPVWQNRPIRYNSDPEDTD